MLRVGFIGLGIMGKPMAKNILKGGFPLTVTSRTRSAVDELAAAGAKAAATPAEVAAASDVVITMLPNSPEVRQVVLGPGGVAEGAAPGLVLADMSSIAPLAVREIAAELAAKGVGMVDAPVSGGEPKAVEGTLAVMAGGAQADFERCLPVLQTMAATVTHVGEAGAGNVAKLANQIMVAGNIAAMSEALVLAAKAGVGPDVVHKAIRAGLAGSTAFDAKAPLVMDGKFDPGFRIRLHAKDLGNVLETSHALGVPLPLTAQLMEVMQGLMASGLGDADHGALIRHWEKLAGVEARRAKE
ncbi:2-hydroxy-3-oxopropionate reductase [Fundidesulfovibrio magnetotacticus]|uniref:2-hydroxy-3-oxopropionate reductase n=2 Tax=Fundidesulfovibrio magnetotacticus TaxID=2730080 RepID=A0A6V8LPD2_9BACT|nr:2-hydroxy-3-oxopropionate reductase [Fundidesulfovibrio magnetotacticus]